MALFADPSQIQDARLLEMAKLTPDQQLFMGAARGAQQLTRGIGSLFGVDVRDPAVRGATKLQELGAKYGTTTADALDKIANDPSMDEFPQLRLEVAQKANELRLQSSKIASEQALTAQRMREKAAVDPLQKLIQEGKYTPESVAAYQQSGNIADLKLVEKAETKSEFERILGSLDLDPKQEKALKQQWVAAKLNPDPSGMKGIQATLASLQAQQLQQKLEKDREKTLEDRRQAIFKLADTESSLETSLNSAEKALKLAPNSFAGASMQSLSGSIPWSDAKALNNLVSTLNSSKVIGTLEQLKTQSRTGATGFGALSEKELTLLLNNIAALDPTDKMFKENLTNVMTQWQRVLQQVKQSRAALQGTPQQTENKPIYARNPQTNERIMSMDGGKTWQPAR